jgi:hypothetical protein
MEAIIIGFSNPTSEGVTIHLNKPSKLKGGNIPSKDFWVSWDKIGRALIDGYTDKTEVDELNKLRNQL